MTGYQFNWRQVLAATNVVAVVFTCALIAGCAVDPYGYRSLSLDESVAVIDARPGPSATTSMTAESVVRVDGGDGRRGTLDGAIAATPHGFRLQAWRGQRTILDVIADDENVWMAGEAADGVEDQSDTRQLPAGIAAALWDAMSGAVIQNASSRGAWTVASSSKLRWNAAAARESTPNELGTMNVVVNRGLLEVTRLELVFEDGRSVSIDLSDHREIALGETDTRRWPHRVDIQTPDQSLLLRLRDVVLNDSIAPAAFKPPRNAVRLGS